MNDDPSDPADEAALDELFERAVACRASGVAVDLDGLLRERPHLHQRALDLLALADEIALVEPPTLPGPPPTTIGGYTLLGEVGRGGMGVVHRARQEALGRIVALKVLPAAALASERARERFRTEARALARLRHPNIVTIHEVLVLDDVAAYAMEWVDGPTLAAAISAHDPDLDVQRVARLGVAIARALAAVHDAGLVHRDVKPGNILLRSDGTPLLSDFSLVRDVEAGQHTATGEFLGTLAYSAPEQVRGEHSLVGPCSDVYSLGVTLYAALAGTAPFGASSTGAIIRRIEDGQCTPLERLAPRVPRDLVNVVAKAMCVEPARRYTTANELAEDLERFLRFEPVLARGVPWPVRAWRFAQRRPALVASLVLGGLLLLGTPTALFLQERMALARERGLRKEADAQRKVAEEATARAQDEADIQRQLTAFLREVIQRGDATQAEGRADITLLEALDAASGALLSENREYRPAVAYAIRIALAELYLGMGRIEPAAQHLAVAEEARKALYLDETEEAATTAFHMARIYRELGKLDEAERAVAEVVRVRRALVARAVEGEPRDLASNYLAQAINSLGIAQRRLGKLAEAEASYAEALGLYRATLGDGHENIAQVLSSIGSLQLIQKRFVEAEASLRQARDVSRRFHTQDGVVTPNIDLAQTTAKLGAILSEVGRHAEGEELLREGFDMARGVVGLAHPKSIDVSHDVALHLQRVGRLDELEALLREVLVACEALEPFGSLRSLRAATLLVDHLAATGRKQEAEALLQRGLTSAPANAEAQGWPARLEQVRATEAR